MTWQEKKLNLRTKTEKSFDFEWEPNPQPSTVEVNAVVADVRSVARMATALQ